MGGLGGLLPGLGSAGNGLGSDPNLFSNPNSFSNPVMILRVTARVRYFKP